VATLNDPIVVMAAVEGFWVVCVVVVVAVDIIVGWVAIWSSMGLMGIFFESVLALVMIYANVVIGLSGLLV
jgi:hypothetical protein